MAGAHYDSVAGSPGANDNASGTVAAYHLAEQIIAHYGQPERTVLVAAGMALIAENGSAITS